MIKILTKKSTTKLIDRLTDTMINILHKKGVNLSMCDKLKIKNDFAKALK